MPLDAQLANLKEIEDFVKGKNTRTLAITSLAITNHHIQECAERWERVVKILKWIGAGMGITILLALANDLHSGILHDMAKAIASLFL